MSDASRARVLVSVLGMRADNAIYSLGGDSYEARLAPIALCALESFEQVIALCTAEAEEMTRPILESGTDDLPVKSVAIPAGATDEEIGEFLKEFTGSIPEESRVVVDITHGFRHLSLLTLLGALYASTLGRVDVEAAYYALQRTPPEASPFVDLRPLIDITGFLYAARVLRERGDPRPLADELSRLGTGDEPVRQVASRLGSIAHAYASALPLELGRHAGLFLRDQLKPFKSALRSRRLPLVDELRSQVEGSLAPMEIRVEGRHGWKRKVALDSGELARQARFIDELLERGSLGPALTLMEEWVISWACLRLGLADRWLDRAARSEATNVLHAVRTIDSSKHGVELSSEQRELARFWKALSEARNAYAHAGMRGNEVENVLSADVNTGWNTIKQVPDFSPRVAARGAAPVLVSAVGTTPGPLYSALCACPADPGCLIAICSEETRRHAAEAVTRAGSSAALIPITFVDPVGGTSEIDQVVAAATPHLLEGPEVLVNLTGGTTLMGLTVERIASEAHRLGRPVRRFGLIDRRTSAEQREDPFRAAEPYWLDSEDDCEGTE